MSSHSHKRLLLIGATGSIGESALDVVREQRDSFSLAGISAHSNADLLLSLAAEYRVPAVALECPADVDEFRKAASGSGIEKVFCGKGATNELVSFCDYDLLVNALMGNAGIEPTITALQRGINVALANKETLVAAGPLVMQAAKTHGATVIPIDSEHSAILQCMAGEKPEQVRKIWLTTSGGPFWGRSPEALQDVTVEQALNHPRWKMGAKITIDSATLMNKGLEVIETQRLFGLPVEQIGVVRHAEHIIHSFVEFIDGSFKAQLSLPDMRLPVIYALTYPERIASRLVVSDPTAFGTMHFEPVQIEQYPCLGLAYEALERGGSVPAVLSAADEIAVRAFIQGEIRFNDIASVIREVINSWEDGEMKELADVIRADDAARKLAERAVSMMRAAAGDSLC
ncbi:1-deoxy-D-xylulose-5-phosphate reductoisomerase [bacterium]|nr:1-deoxy-D-xylulose-5-phosphate reductoisomerase [bacterium]